METCLLYDKKLHVAPMLAVTDRHYRQLCRLLSRRAVLWTEMIHADAILHNGARLLPFDAVQQPCVLQLGGSLPETLARAAAVGAGEHGYTEVNLNCGCPSGKVCHKRDAALCFGARLMLDPEHTGECLRRMAEAVDVPVSVKCRMGVDKRAEYEDLLHFVDVVTAASGVTRVTVHARAALLGGLSTSANRRVPPLRHAEVYRLKRDFPRLEVTLNGGVETLAQAQEHLQHVDGVMLGRALQRNPLLLADVDAELFGDAAPRPQLSDVLHAYRAYVDDQVAAAGPADDAFHARKTRQRANKPLQIAALAREARSRGLGHLLPGDDADDAEGDAPCAEATS